MLEEPEEELRTLRPSTSSVTFPLAEPPPPSPLLPCGMGGTGQTARAATATTVKGAERNPTSRAGPMARRDSRPTPCPRRADIPSPRGEKRQQHQTHVGAQLKRARARARAGERAQLADGERAASASG